MALVVYAGCIKIRCRSFDGSLPAREYSDRSIVRLYKVDSVPESYFLKATDHIPSEGEKIIFEIPLSKRDIYKFGSSDNQPDEIRYNNRIYTLYLKLGTHAQFHEKLHNCFDIVGSLPQGESTLQSERSTTIQLRNSSKEPRTIATVKAFIGQYSTNLLVLCLDILNGVHELTKSIQTGEVNRAAELASKLADQGVQLTKKNIGQDQPHDSLRIHVKIDGMDLPSNYTAEEHTLNIYQSTTIRELKAMFQHTCGFSIVNQYFFVNGHLAHEICSMHDLRLEDGAFFILFVNEQVHSE
ncbi:unnamed protein product [Adineta ricciae]|uniref:Ubiquitin-like domain-containing protein n=1 Tax=Adineta ricciae TaxID=249248 RepID=A0A815EB20_ADIRI|nr:unnamed protein product [Adineta ricciae]